MIEVFHCSTTKDEREPRGNLSATPQSNMRKQIPTTNTNLDLTNIGLVVGALGVVTSRVLCARVSRVEGCENNWTYLVCN